MKVVILAGGLGTRLMEETSSRPKPMVEIGGKPILWHIIKHFTSYGINEFIICLGYKGFMIKDYFLNYHIHNSDISIDVKKNDLEIHSTDVDDFKITLVDTGEYTNTAGRIKRIEKYIKEEQFMLTYGDGVGNVNLSELQSFHNQTNKLATLTTVRSPSRFGNLSFKHDGTTIDSFIEKPEGENMWINSGYFVLNRGIFQFLNDPNIDDIQWEHGPLKEIAKKGQLSAYRHSGFWKPMDALRDKIQLEEMWESGKAPWKIW